MEKKSFIRLNIIFIMLILLISCLSSPKKPPNEYEKFLVRAKDVAYTEDTKIIESFRNTISQAVNLASPDFTDDFSTNQGWVADWIPSDAIKIDNGKLVITNLLTNKDMQAHIYNKVNQFSNFVCSMDFFFDTDDESYASLTWKASRDGWISIDVHSSGDVQFSMPHQGVKMNAAIYYDKHNKVVYRQGVKNSLLVISVNGNHAFYLNDKPSFLMHEKVLPKSDRAQNKIELMAGSNTPNAIVSFDNFKIWDLDGLM